ncbi:MAG: hypothetical protein Kow00117_11360 [Phototrophicales bacterium]
MDIIGKRKWYFLFSGLVIGLGILMMVLSTIETGAPFKLSIDFVGGSIYEFRFIEEGATESAIRDVFAQNGEENVVIQRLGSTGSEWWVKGNLTATEIDQAITAVLPEPDISVQVSEVEETVYIISFTSDTTLDTAELREYLVNQGLNEAFVRPAEENSWTIVTPTNDINRLEEALTALNESSPLTFERLPGTVFEVTISDETIDEAFVTQALPEATFIQRKPYRWSVRGGFEDQTTNDNILSGLEELAELDRSSLRISSISETVGAEVTRTAFIAVAMAALVVTGFIVIAFRQIPKATRYGICAIAAMVHDVLVVMGFMSLMGMLLGWEIDALFLTAVLTVVGFSVQDSIVMFDRIRENIPKHLGESYETIVNRSIWETIHRSLATQLNAFFVMAAILLFGGETIKQFIAVLFVGLLSGTYSSIFTAVPLLVAWEKGEIPFVKGNKQLAQEG